MKLYGEEINLQGYIPWVIAAITLFAYLPSFEASFQFDDFGYIIRNAKTHDPFNLANLWTVTGAPTRFFAFFTFAFNYWIHGPEPFGFHVVNFIIHLFNGWAVFSLTRLVLAKTHRKLSSTTVKIIGILITLFFLLHPIQTQSVTYITQRFTSLSTCFYLWSVIWAIHFLTQRKLKPAIIAGFLFLFGLFSKEIIITAPIIIFVLMNSLYKKEVSATLRRNFFILMMIVIPILPLFFLLADSSFFVERPSDSVIGEVITPWNYFLTQQSVIWDYWKLLIFPINLNLDYYYPLVQSLGERWTWLKLLAHASLLGLGAWRFFRYHSLIGLGICWFYLTIALESSIFPIENVIFEHRTYLPFIGFAWILTGLFLKLQQHARIILPIFIIVLIAFARLTYERNIVWKSEQSLWEDVLAKSPEKFRPYLKLGIIYSRDNQFSKSLAMFNKALELHPDSTRAYNNRAYVHSRMGNKQMVLADLNRAIELDPNNHYAFLNRADIYRELKQYEQSQADFDHFFQKRPNNVIGLFKQAQLYASRNNLQELNVTINRILKLNPNHFQTLFMQAQLQQEIPDRITLLENLVTKSKGQGRTYVPALNQLCEIKTQQKEYLEALHFCQRSLEFDRQQMRVIKLTAHLYIVLQKPLNALDHLNNCLKLRPNDGTCYFMRGKLFFDQQRFQMALKDFQQAQRLNINDAGRFIQQIQSLQ